jgi:hypothetical protein
MIVSNRATDGRSTGYTGNDIFQIHWDGTSWQVTRLNEVNSSEWDDSPALSPDGTRLYFASDRAHPGTRRADLCMSEFRDGAWSAPRPLVQLNTDEFSEETPYISEDGYLYYSTNRKIDKAVNGRSYAGDFDIWRTKLDAHGMPSDAGELVAGINAEGSDETHPVISPGGGFLLYSTNANGKGGRKDFDIRWIKLKRHEAPLTIDVRKRRRQTTERVSADIHITSVGEARAINEIRSSATEPINITLENILGNPASPAGDRREFELIARAVPDSQQFISAVDTLVGVRTCDAFAPHTIFLWDTATYYEQRCVDTFPIKKVQYFVTGYWCPTTSRYASYLSCPTLFVDSACLKPVCSPSDLYNYRVSVARAHSECIDYAEFDRQGASFARAVDDALDQHVAAMASAFGSACMKRTVARGGRVRVVVEGFTDPRGYGGDCHYFGPDIDFTKSSVQVPAAVQSHFHHDARMKAYGAQGNQLLSELRAYNLASLLDALWTEHIPEYRALKSAGLLTTVAIGRAISQDQIPFEERRSAQVSIEAESDSVIIRGETPPPGQRVVLCQSCP